MYIWPHLSYVFSSNYFLIFFPLCLCSFLKPVCHCRFIKFYFVALNMFHLFNVFILPFSVILRFPKTLKNFLESLYNFFSKALYFFFQPFPLLLLGDSVCCLYNFWNYGELFVETMPSTLSELCITPPLIPFLIIFIVEWDQIWVSWVSFTGRQILHHLSHWGIPVE